MEYEKFWCKLFSQAIIGKVLKLPLNKNRILQYIMKAFRNKSFFRQSGQAFEQYPLVKAYDGNESKLSEKVRIVKCLFVPCATKEESSHVA